MSCACLVTPVSCSVFLMVTTVWYPSGSCLIKSQAGEVLSLCSEVTYACFADRPARVCTEYVNSRRLVLELLWERNNLIV